MPQQFERRAPAAQVILDTLHHQRTAMARTAGGDFLAGQPHGAHDARIQRLTRNALTDLAPEGKTQVDAITESYVL